MPCSNCGRGFYQDEALREGTRIAFMAQVEGTFKTPSAPRPICDTCKSVTAARFAWLSRLARPAQRLYQPGVVRMKREGLWA